MTQAEAKLPAKADKNLPSHSPSANLRRVLDRFFDDLDGRFWTGSFGRSFFDEFPVPRPVLNMPAVDIVEKDAAFEITADLPGMEEKDIEVRTSNGGLVIRGERKTEKEEKDKNYYLSERSLGSFERYFGLPGGVDAEKIAASFKNGVLTVTLPKTAEARKADKKIPIKAE